MFKNVAKYCGSSIKNGSVLSNLNKINYKTGLIIQNVAFHLDSGKQLELL